MSTLLVLTLILFGIAVLLTNRQITLLRKRVENLESPRRSAVTVSMPQMTQADARRIAKAIRQTREIPEVKP